MTPTHGGTTIILFRRDEEVSSVSSPQTGGHAGPIVFEFDSGGQAVQAVFEPPVADISTGGTIDGRLSLAVPDTVVGASTKYQWKVEIYAQLGNVQGELLATADFQVKVHNFYLTAAPTAVTVKAKNSASFTIYKHSHDSGFATDLWMRAYGLPKYATAVFTPDTMADADQWTTLKITTKANTPPGKYQIWIKGYYFTQSVPVELTVTR